MKRVCAELPTTQLNRQMFIQKYLIGVLLRRKHSRLSIQHALVIIDKFFDDARAEGSLERRRLRQALGYLDSHCLAEFTMERQKISDLVRRDPTLMTDELSEAL